MNKEEIKKLAEGYFQSSQFIAKFMTERIHPLLNTLIELENREATLKGLFLSALAWMKSVEKLNSPVDFQALVTANRALLEILIDMIFVHHDKTDDSVNKMEAWEESNKLKTAKCLVAYYQRKNQDIPHEFRHEKIYIDKKGLILNNNG